MKRFFAQHLDDLLIVTGGLVMVYGISEVSRVVAIIVGGAMLIALGILVGIGAKNAHL